MQRKTLIPLVLGLSGLLAVLAFRDHGRGPAAAPVPAPLAAVSPAPGAAPAAASPTAPVLLHTPAALASAQVNSTAAPARPKPDQYRLRNTTESLAKLQHNPRAILLGNAFIDTAKGGKLEIPDTLRAPADHGTYIVQARGENDAAFRAALAAAGATLVPNSYIPNHAFVVRLADASAPALAGNPNVAAVLPYEPYYKLDPSLINPAVQQQPLPTGLGLKLAVFPDALDATLVSLAKLEVKVIGDSPSPLGGTLLTVQAPTTATAVADLARLSGVQWIQPSRARIRANELVRTTLGAGLAATNTTTYLNLTGTNILIALPDLGVDITHPDLTNRVTGDNPASLTDVSGHGTHVAGTIIGSGVMSTTVSNAPGSVVGANFQGLAPAGLLYSMSLFQNVGVRDPLRLLSGLSLDYTVGYVSDAYLQAQAAQTNALISNNSWNYDRSSAYDIEAASYDAAVRDSLPLVTGSQPLIYVFSAGNGGGGTDDGQNGVADSILSPATAKNVITVGAVEQNRNLTNSFMNGTNAPEQPFLAATDANDQIAGFSSRGNVGIGVEGTYGRFKPDVVAPGTLVISDRSSTWDTNAYYFPTNDDMTMYNLVTVNTNQLAAFGLYVPDNATAVYIQAYTTAGAPLPIYLRLADNPTLTTYDYLGSGLVTMPPALGTLPLASTVFYSIGNNSTQALTFNVQVDILTTNDTPEISFFLRTNLNDALGPNYRYESGTSMAAAGVSGFLALLEEFYQQRLGLTNSPALMKALLINGARSVGPLYDFQVQNGINYQGWGLPNISNSIPSLLTNFPPGTPLPPTLPIQFVDQSPTNALASGQSQTWNLTFDPSAQGQDAHITLVWTDPPGNPAAAIKLVNNLDLVVTNLDTGEVFLGNDIPTGSVYTQAWDTNGLPNLDLVNNVENIYLGAPLGARYSVTVFAERVNVNAVTANTNNIVQDFALVISSGDAGSVSNAFTLTSVSPVQPIAGNVITNTYTVLTNGLPLLDQRVGANSPYTGSRAGSSNQWNFYVYTNTTMYQYVAFITFLPNDLGVTRMGAQRTDPYNAVRGEADIDLYVSNDPGMLNLDTNTLAAAVAAGTVSLTRSGTEKVLYSNSVPGQVYYIGIKSEDQLAGQFAFLGVASALPFGQRDPNGNVQLTPLTYLPTFVPDGSPSLPGTTNVLLISTLPDIVRRVIVTNSIVHPRASDLLTVFSHRKKYAVLKNHTPFDNGLGAETYVYDDSGQGDIKGAVKTDGPGSLRTFANDQASDGVWVLNAVDDSPTEIGSITNFQVTIEPQIQTNRPRNFAVGPMQWLYDPITVPVQATNLTAFVSNLSGPVNLYIRRGDYPDQNNYDKFIVLQPTGGSLSVTKYDLPPLNAGEYVIGVYNPSPNTTVNFTLEVVVGLDLTPVPPTVFQSVGNEPLRDDAVTYSTNHVSNQSTLTAVEVGVRIAHPRESDLAYTIISPSGTRVLLAENRGGLDTNGYGSGVTVTNSVPLTTSGGAAANTNVVGLAGNQGTLIVNYNFYEVPDRMDVYYDGALIYDTGLISYSNTFSVNFGPGLSTNLVIVMNQGNNSQTNTLWNYSAVVVSHTLHYATFTENTNYALVPIKYAPTPFAPSTNITTTLLSDFEGASPGDYPSGQIADAWNVLANRVTIMNTNAQGNPAFANTGIQALNLRNGQIEQDLATVGGDTYVINFAYRRAPALAGLVGWWPGEANYSDLVNSNTATAGSGAQFTNGLAGMAFYFDGLADSLVRAMDTTNLDFPSNSPMSLELWAYRTGPQTAMNLVGKAFNAGTPASINYLLWMDPTNGLSFGGPSALGGVSSAQPLPSNTWVHVAATYDGANFNLYTNGTLAATGTGLLGAANAADLQIGGVDGGADFQGALDEITLYNRALTAAEVQDIYSAGKLGKCGITTPPAACPACGANITVNGLPVGTITGMTNWQTNAFTFTGTTLKTALEIDYTNNPSGLLLDTFIIKDFPGGPYYQPEDYLSKLIGEPSQGDWVLEIVDNRAGATNPPPSLVSWQLSLTLEDTTARALPLSEGVPQTITVAANTIRYFSVAMPAWAAFATNIMSGASGNVNLLYDPSFEPTGYLPGDVTLITSAKKGTAVLGTNGVPFAGGNVTPGGTYYLGVQNIGVIPINVTLEVDFNITTLVNGVGVSNTIPVGLVPQYYQFDVVSNGVAVAFEILNPTGDANLFANFGLPLPTLSLFNYDSINGGTNNQAIVLLTNSTPVPLSVGRWYLGVYNNDFQPVGYTIRATEVGAPTIINLTDGVPVNFNSAPGVALTNFFHFNVGVNTNGVVFELYNLSGNADLDIQFGGLPYVAPFTAISANSGTNSEIVGLTTALTGGPLLGDWYLGVPNNDPTNVTYTVLAMLSSNGMATATSPFKILAVPAKAGSNTGLTLSWPATSGQTYKVYVSSDLHHWVLAATIAATSGTVSYTDPSPSPAHASRYYRVARVVPQ